MVGEEEEHKYSYRRKGGVKDGWREGGDERWREGRGEGSGCLYLLQLGEVGGEPRLCSNGEHLDQMLAPFSPVLTQYNPLYKSQLQYSGSNKRRNQPRQ